MKPVVRCEWVRSDVATPYHDEEWGVPVRDERKLFEMLTLEGAQAGLSWDTILRKRDGYREAFHQFDTDRVAKMSAADVERLINFEGIVRNRLKIESTIGNARAIVALRRDQPFEQFLWAFVDGKPIRNHWKTLGEFPAKTDLSDRVSKELRKRGFRFVGSTIIYAFMQATGMVNDHQPGCFRTSEVAP
jgi:DNA-3-methyladenine glycosylase I